MATRVVPDRAAVLVGGLEKTILSARPNRGKIAAMAPLPYSDTGAGIGFFVLVGLFAALEEFLIIRTLVRHEGARADRGSHLVFVGCVVVGVGGAFVLAAVVDGATIGGARWPAFAVGIALMVVGLTLRVWSIRVLGRSFTVDVRVREGQTVVDSGPYRWVRHPSYTGLLLICAGVGLAFGNAASLACAVLIPCAGCVVRVRIEERALLQELGEPYRLFAEGRARLIPAVW